MTSLLRPPAADHADPDDPWGEDGPEPDDPARPSWEARQLTACELDPSYLTHHYGVIDNVQDGGDSGEGTPVSTVRFRLWPRQFPVFGTIQAHRQVIILKARQLGISWVVCAYVLWLCLFHPGRVVMIFSKGQRESDEMIRRVGALFARLPDWLRARLPSLETDNTRELKWSNGSRVQGMPATADAGVSFTASLIVLDEAARMKFGRQLYVAAKPTIDGGGQIIVLSSANGMGGFFHNLWDKAASGISSFVPVFLPWWARPDRTRGWLAQVTRDADDPALVPQEYPANPVEAFVASGRLRFDPKRVALQAKNVRDPIPPELWPDSMHARPGWPGLNAVDLPRLRDIPGLRVYKFPEPGRRYVVSGDVAEGKDPEGKRDSDFDAAVLVDEETWEEYASLHGRWEPDVFGLYLMALSDPYNGAVILAERNNHGHTTLLEFKHKRLPAARLGLGADGWPGWLRDGKTKPEAEATLSAALRDELVTVRTRAALMEMHVYSVLKNGNTGAPVGYHDDFVAAWSNLLAWLRRRSSFRPSDGSYEVGGDAPRMTGFLSVPTS